MNKKIFIINNSSKISGAEKSLLNLLDSLKEHYSFIVAVPIKKDDLYNTLVGLNYNVKCFNILRYSRNHNFFTKVFFYLNTFKVSLQMSKYVLYENIDIVYSNSNQAVVYSFIIKLLTFKKVIWHVRDSITNSVLAAIFAWHADRIICVSKFIYNQIPAKKNKKTIIYNGIDADVWHKSSAIEHSLRQSLKLDSNILLVGQIGQLIPWKNHMDFIKTAKHVFASFQSVHFIIIGADLFNTNPLYVEEIKNRIEQEGLTAHFTFTGHLENIHSYIEQLDVIVHCAKEEPFGRVLIEAMALEKPVAGYCSAGAGEVIINGVTGLLAPTGNVYELSKCVLKLLNDKRLRDKLGKRAREEVKHKFLLKFNTAAMKEVFKAT